MQNLMNDFIFVISFGKNVDPLKDLIFGKPIPLEYKEYIDIIFS